MGPIEKRRRRDARAREGLIGGLHAGEQHRRRLPSRRRRENAGNRNGVGSLDGLVPDANGAVRALGKTLAQRLVCVLGSDGDDDDFDGLGGRLLDLDRLLEREIVPLVQIAQQKLLIDVAAVRADGEVLVERGDLLDGDQDLHASAVSARGAGTASRMSSINSFTTNFPSLPVVLSASSNMVRSFGQLTTYTSSPGIAAASRIRF